MKTLTVGLGERSYPITIGSGILPALGESLRAVAFPRKVAVVTNPTVSALYGAAVLDTLREAGFHAAQISVPDGEAFKNLDTLNTLFDELIARGYDRGSGILALGGGVIGDLAGFAAAVYLRGIPFAQVPTTLLSQVDSSVGGKTGVNHRLGKNLIGAFYQPRHVHIDVNTLSTLPPREFRSGLAEVVKYGVVRDADFFAWLEREHAALLALEAPALVEAVRISCQIKADIVEIDEKEGGLRAILNYGHTLGHAAELLAGYGTLRHGEAVAMGMVAAAAIAADLGLASEPDRLRIEDLLRALDLPVRLPAFAPAVYLDALTRDKKVKEGVLQMVLNRGIGDCVLHSVAHPDRIIPPILEKYCEKATA
ncbi:3-dehydroquinate synthase [Geoalkalibacter ferrihydriticus]|uniref:3-dehydroquinate synthase n=2 Tax=Geoalkalibacter ferrihydriticus TaxID=392333 RepID=A0A0C2HPL8_9BACT|nr:3-dehydroquinate synthase [Geoalkalibacter ferrihydriticus]KIH76900.1 3-dehydroquinate synthase [Geoalkalibacter ferrihydriticus DSM 17813]SDL45439.1 3-dehydroquinate synthase [Geoalkalibacter ferrihydriticus]